MTDISERLGRVFLLVLTLWLTPYNAAVAQTAVSLDGKDVVITGLDNTDSRRVNIGSDQAHLVAANARHAYVFGPNGGSGRVLQVDFNTGEQRESVPRLPCCASAFAVSPDDKTLFVGSDELEQGEIAAYDTTSGRRLYGVPVMARPLQIFFDGQRVVVASRTSPLAQ